jgi:mRNA-degrading endonuclease YafQ of YafQ-DinJ toxin-antitoxin module
MRPAKVSQFMKWRDEQAEYQRALRLVLRLSEEAEALEARGVESHPLLEEWRQAREGLLQTEALLITRFEARSG